MYCTWESIDTDHGPRTTDDDDGHTLNLYYYTSREGLRQVYDGRSSIQIISIGNDYWGPLIQKKGGTLRGLRIYHSIDNETNPPQATMVVLK